MQDNKTLNEAENEKKHLTSEERQRQYHERATQKRIEEYRKRKRKKRGMLALIILAAFVLIGGTAAVVILERTVWKPARTYAGAAELYAAGEYLDAYDIFISLGDYRDAASIAASCITKNAQKLSGREEVLLGTSASMPWFKLDDLGAISFDADKYSGGAELIIPDVFNNELVTAVASKGFFYARGIDTVILPPSVRRLESQAFFASSIKTLVLPDEVTYIGEKAFEDCALLTSVTLPAKLKEIGTAAFRNCDELTSLTFPEGFAVIGARAVASCEKLSSVRFPSTLEAIGGKAFEGCDGLSYLRYNGTRDAFAALCSGEGNDTLLSVKETEFN